MGEEEGVRMFSDKVCLCYQFKKSVICTISLQASVIIE